MCRSQRSLFVWRSILNNITRECQTFKLSLSMRVSSARWKRNGTLLFAAIQVGMYTRLSIFHSAIIRILHTCYERVTMHGGSESPHRTVQRRRDDRCKVFPMASLLGNQSMLWPMLPPRPPVPSLPDATRTARFAIPGRQRPCQHFFAFVCESIPVRFNQRALQRRT